MTAFDSLVHPPKVNFIHEPLQLYLPRNYPTRVIFQFALFRLFVLCIFTLLYPTDHFSRYPAAAYARMGLLPHTNHVPMYVAEEDQYVPGPAAVATATASVAVATRWRDHPPPHPGRPCVTGRRHVPRPAAR